MRLGKVEGGGIGLMPFFIGASVTLRFHFSLLFTFQSVLWLLYLSASSSASELL